MTSHDAKPGPHQFDNLTATLQAKDVMTALAAAFDNPNLLDAQGIEKLGVGLPREISLEGFVVETRPPPIVVGLPGPDWIPRELALTMCRSYWVRKPHGQVGFEQVEVCRGFRVVVNPIPGGPIGR